MDGECPHNQLQLTLLIKGEEGEPIDIVGFVWDLPNLFPDLPERPEKRGKYSVRSLDQS